MKNEINDIYHCNTDVKAANKFIMVTNKHLDALDVENVCYRAVRSLTVSNGRLYYNIAVNHKEISKVLFEIQHVNVLAAQKSKLTFI